MRRVLVLGPCGAGKSTFARRLGDATGLPVVYLDQEFWKPGWVMTPRAVWEQRVRELAAGDRWVMDGNYDSTLHLRTPRADTIVYLDFPRRLFMARIFRRIAADHGRTRVDMAPGCPERLNLEFFRFAWNFNRDVRPAVLDTIARLAPRSELLVFTHPAAAETWLTKIR